MEYICMDCGEHFDVSEIKTTEDKEYIDGRLMNINYIYSCPYCGGESLEEAAECKFCGEWFAKGELDEEQHCSNCKEDIQC